MLPSEREALRWEIGEILRPTHWDWAKDLTYMLVLLAAIAGGILAYRWGHADGLTEAGLKYPAAQHHQFCVPSKTDQTTE